MPNFKNIVKAAKQAKQTVAGYKKCAHCRALMAEIEAHAARGHKE